MRLKIRRHHREGDTSTGLIPRALSRRWLIAAGLAVGALAVGIGVVVGGAAGDRVGSGFSPPAPQPPPAPAVPDATPGFVRFLDGRGRFSIDFPRDWKRLATPDAELLAARGRVASLLVRSVPLRFRVERRDLSKVEALTDEIVASGSKVKLLAESRQIELGGLPGYFYFYSFRDPKTRRRGTHSHYFLFQGTTMITIVLQALPDRYFERFVTDFDRIAASFRAAPR
ncbi:MAG: hypothetical protein H0U12_13740 [Thermoleophilaceae bacterium]|nr:hypothetical protein [Thermoleophilaceae bacterium]